VGRPRRQRSHALLRTSETSLPASHPGSDVTEDALRSLAMDADRLLAGLDDGQRRAVTTSTNPLCILAGAGSGKTRVLTRRIAYRAIRGDLDPRRVLAVTFSRRAAGELSERLRTFGLRDLPAAGTIHATAYAQLRDRWAGGDRRPPSLLDRKGRLLGRLVGASRRFNAGDLAAEIEWAKARLVTPADYPAAAAKAGRTTAVPATRVGELYAGYEHEKRTHHLVDFDDLLARCADAVEDDPSFAAAQRWRFQHFFVDEYQDVNPLQERLLRAWIGDRTDLCVVGDPNQAIYRWNGADASFLLRFTKRHPGAEVVDLTDNYRSTAQVLRVAAAVLAGEGGRPRPMRAHREDGPLPRVVTYPSDVAEAAGIARAVRDNRGPGVGWSGQAVLVRTNAQTSLIEAALRRVGIPYRVRGGNAFLDDPDVKRLLRTLSGERVPFSTTLADLEASLPTMGDVAGRHRQDQEADEDAGDEVSGGATAGTVTATTAGAPLDPDSAAGRRRAALETVVRFGRDFLTLDRLAPTSAFPGWLFANVRSEDADRSGDAVTLASFHAAKGLEWPIVHLAGLEDGLSPITHARRPEALAEERRLVYVAMTRAERHLRISWAQQRTFGAKTVVRRPSPYLSQVLAANQDLAAVATPAAPSAAPGLVAGSRARLSTDTAADEALIGALRTWRDEMARAARVAPTVVLSDRTLLAVATRRPSSREALGDLPGLGPLGVDRYGTTLLALVADHGLIAPMET